MKRNEVIDQLKTNIFNFRIWKITIALLTLCLVGSSAIAQSTEENDRESRGEYYYWFGAKADIDLSKSLHLEAEYQHRRDEGIRELEQNFAEFSLRYKVFKFLYLKPSFRLVRGEELNEDRVRFSNDVTFKLKPRNSDFQFSNRTRIQYTSFLHKERTRRVLRNRVGVKYRGVKGFEPRLTYEIFVREGRIDDARVRFGVEWAMNDDFAIAPFYAQEYELDAQNAPHRHILGIGLLYSTKIKKKERPQDP